MTNISRAETVEFVAMEPMEAIEVIKDLSKLNGIIRLGIYGDDDDGLGN